jgi:hypothetical protein
MIGMPTPATPDVPPVTPPGGVDEGKEVVEETPPLELLAQLAAKSSDAIEAMATEVCMVGSARRAERCRHGSSVARSIFRARLAIVRVMA